MSVKLLKPFHRSDAKLTGTLAWYWLTFALGVALLTWLLLDFFDRHALNRPQTYTDPLVEFYYGSIATDMDNGLPLAVLEVLPEVFPNYLPEDDSPRDYRAFGLIQEPGRRMPIGFSERLRVIDFTGPNCAICHTGRVVTQEHPDGLIIPGMPSNTVDLQAFFQFLFACAEDWRFTPEYLLPAMAQHRELDTVERLAYQLVIPLLQGQLLARKAKLKHYFGDASTHPRWGPGRVDTFDTFKFDHFAYLYAGDEISLDERYGTVDLPPIWNQSKRHGLSLHWDGNNNSVRERNFSAAMAAGATRKNIDSEKERLFAIEAWLETSLTPPAYPFPIDQALAKRGETIYRKYCFDCHAFEGKQIGHVVPIDEIGTDRGRLDSYTDKFRQIQTQYTAGRDWAFTRFRKTNGYANLPLDGLWARAPYLHNGSVPTLFDMLEPEERRPREFYIGDIVYQPDQVGFRHDQPQAPDGRKLLLLDTNQFGNGNQGHSGEAYGTELGVVEKRALLEYLKTL